MQIVLRLALSIVLLFGSLAAMASLKQPDRLDETAEQFIILALQLGKYDKDYVDAYYGPRRLRKLAEEAPGDQQTLTIAIDRLYEDVQRYRPWNNLNRARHSALLKNIRAMHTRMRMINGETLSFRDEARLIYDVKLPRYEFADFDETLQKISELMGNPENLIAAVDAYRNSLTIPEDVLTQVVETALEECRLRTKKYIDLPEDERFRLEYVTDTNWGGYNWYQGDNESLMQINMDFPMRIDRAVSLGCHEGYPGHHVWNVLVENELYKNGWQEFSLIPLFSPFGLIAEGSAKYGVQLAFPGNEKLLYEQQVLYPMARLDPAEAEKLAELNRLTAELSHSSIAIAELYLDGEISRDEAITMRQKYSLVSRDRAEKSIRFTEQYRAYVVNYSLGEDILGDYIERRAKTPKKRWELFV
ncbi:MAG: hypothetical protein KJO69_10860, partial [Gammaproteobacteria bacterium]|nr:hypothetical protein [Gammaproteobacteria bacterium]